MSTHTELSATEMFEKPSAGTSGQGWEAEKWRENGPEAQTDDAEATDPEAAAERRIAELEAKIQQLAAGQGSAPDGFRWAKDNSGKPTLLPTRQNVDALAATCKMFYENADEREALMHRDTAMIKGLNDTLSTIDFEQKYAPIFEMARYVQSQGDAAPSPEHIKKCLTRAVRRIDAVNQYMATSLIKTVCRQAAQDMASSLFWLEIHAQNVVKHRDALREDAAEKSLLMYESSRTQALMAAQILDWASDNEIAPDTRAGAESALRLRGWQQANQQTAVNRATQREYDTRTALFGHDIS